jgi:hypothetical protein
LFNATLNIATSTAGISRFQSKYASGVSLTRITVIGEELSLHRRNATRAHQLMKQVLFTFLASIYVYKRPATCETAYDKDEAFLLPGRKLHALLPLAAGCIVA